MKKLNKNELKTIVATGIGSMRTVLPLKEQGIIDEIKRRFEKESQEDSEITLNIKVFDSKIIENLRNIF